MRITKLYIAAYKQFQPHITINLDSEISVLIGVNGSGKSSIFEALALIFTEVKMYCEDGKSRETKLDFKIEYNFVSSKVIEGTSISQELKTSVDLVELSSTAESGLQFSMAVNGEMLKSREEMLSHLPDNLVFYYAGYSQNLKNIVSAIEDRQAKLFYSIKGDDVSLVSEILSKQITYIKEQHFPILFIINYLKSKEHVLPITNEEYKVRNITLVLQRPRDFANNDYKNLYDLKGLLRNYLDAILRLSYSGKVEMDSDRQKPFILIEYHQSLLDAIQDLGNWNLDYLHLNDSYILFYVFNLLLEIGVLESIEVAIETNKSKTPFLIRDLSEGEQQIITICTLKQHLLKGNSVLIMDEPDAFLHPQRQREVVPYLSDLFTDSYNQILLATHSPNLINKASSKNVNINILSGKGIKNIGANFYGRKISSINYDFMGVPERPEETQQRINDLFEAIELEKFEGAFKIYEELVVQLGKSDADLIRAKVELDFLKSVE